MILLIYDIWKQNFSDGEQIGSRVYGWDEHVTLYGEQEGKCLSKGTVPMTVMIVWLCTYVKTIN